jgi:hypothetical protein
MTYFMEDVLIKNIVKYSGLCSSFFLLASAQIHAADIRPHVKSTYTTIIIEGEIKEGDLEKLIRLVKDGQGKVIGVNLFSAGGNFYEAMKIGRALRALELGSQIPIRDSSDQPSCVDNFGMPVPNDPLNCTALSAAFFIHIGGNHMGGNYVGVHRPYFSQSEFGELSESDAKKAFDLLQTKAKEYMNEMDVPKHVQEDVLGTPSDKILVLDDKVIKTYFWGDFPYRHEWLNNKCSKLSATERMRSESYSERLRKAREARYTNEQQIKVLTPTEWDDLGVLQDKRSEQGKCIIKIKKQLRKDAYIKYFGEEPADYKKHDFTKWISAPGYLGKEFYTVLSEERFEEEKENVLGGHSMTRAVSVTSPYTRLSDSHITKNRIVDRINVLSAPNPSDGFIRKLVETLEKAWGTATIGKDSDGYAVWTWSSSKYKATLTHELVSSQGPYMSLIVESK